MNKIKELAKELCEKSPCHHKCHDTDKCVVEDEAEAILDGKSNQELFKQALVEGVNRRIDKDIEQGKQIEGYLTTKFKPQNEIDGIAWLLLNIFGCKFCETFRNEPCNIKEGESCTNNIANYIREAVKAEADCQKQSEWISVEDRLPEDVYGKDRKKITVLVCTESGKVSTASRQRIFKFNSTKCEWVELDTFEWSKRKRVTHWMHLPKIPEYRQLFIHPCEECMKGGGSDGNASTK